MITSHPTSRAFLVAFSLICGVTFAETPFTPTVQGRAPEGRVWTLHDFDDAELVVVAFLGTECPLAKLYGRRLAELHDHYAAQGVAFIGINSNRQDTLTEIAAYGRRHAIPFPVLKDESQTVANALGATRTPEVFVLDAQRKVRYQGRIDDQYVVGLSRNEPQQTELRDAIDALLANEVVKVSKTEAVGCLIGRKKPAATDGDLTYARDIAPIFNQHCVSCHREGEIAPFPLATHADVIGWEDMIVEVIEERRMPPWFANPAHGSFANDARLSDEERELIVRWVDQGAPVGDPADLPDPPQFTQGWRIPEPDQVFKMREVPFPVPASGVVDYQYFVVDPEWKEDKYIYAAEARPDNTAVVHHILVYILPADGDVDIRKVLVGYAPGSVPKLLTDGIAIHVPAGSRLMFEMHYTPNGYATEDCSYAGVCFLDKQDVKTIFNGRLAMEDDFRIPAGAAHHEVKAKFRFRQPEQLLAMTPHMHLRGKSFRYEARYPDGQEEILLDVPAYDFNWQLKYTLSEPKPMPAGTEIICTAVYDNSTRNLANPDPTRSVGWGDQSWEEMMIGFFDTIPDGADSPRR
ncbi:MAG: redoxin domain-containing protein [Planctomycetota bacterium]